MTTTAENAPAKLQQLLKMDTERRTKANQNFSREVVVNSPVPEIPLTQVADGLASAAYIENPIMNNRELVGSQASQSLSRVTNKFSMPPANVSVDGLSLNIPASVRIPSTGDTLTETDRRLMLTALIDVELAKKVRIKGLQAGLENICSALSQWLYVELNRSTLQIGDTRNYPEYTPPEEETKKAILLLFSAHVLRPLDVHAQAKNIQIVQLLKLIIEKIIERSPSDRDMIATEITDPDLAEILS